jgi:hypothetical protein
MSADPATNVGKGAYKIEPPHLSNPIMRRLSADLEEKHEPRGTHLTNRTHNVHEKD